MTEQTRNRRAAVLKKLGIRQSIAIDLEKRHRGAARELARSTGVSRNHAILFTVRCALEEEVAPLLALGAEPVTLYGMPASTLLAVIELRGWLKRDLRLYPWWLTPHASSLMNIELPSALLAEEQTLKKIVNTPDYIVHGRGLAELQRSRRLDAIERKFLVRCKGLPGPGLADIRNVEAILVRRQFLAPPCSADALPPSPLSGRFSWLEFLARRLSSISKHDELAFYEHLAMLREEHVPANDIAGYVESLVHFGALEERECCDCSSPYFVPEGKPYNSMEDRCPGCETALKLEHGVHGCRYNTHEEQLWAGIFDCIRDTERRGKNRDLIIFRSEIAHRLDWLYECEVAREVRSARTEEELNQALDRHRIVLRASYFGRKAEPFWD